MTQCSSTLPDMFSRDDPKPFSQQIMEELILPPFHHTQDYPFSGVEDPESHLKAFTTQMIMSGGSDAIRCKMLMGTFIGTTLQWFNRIPNDHITFFPQFSRIFKENFSANKVCLLYTSDAADE